MTLYQTRSKPRESLCAVHLLSSILHVYFQRNDEFSKFGNGDVWDAVLLYLQVSWLVTHSTTISLSASFTCQLYNRLLGTKSRGIYKVDCTVDINEKELRKGHVPIGMTLLYHRDLGALVFTPEQRTCAHARANLLSKTTL